MNRAYVLVTTIAVGVCGSHAALGCSRDTPISVFEVVDEADAIVWATATEYAVAPQSDLRTTGEPDSRVRFKVVDVLRGPLDLSDVELGGYLGDDDDFNDHAPPYTVVRRGGRAGSCFANTYRRGADYLLFLKKQSSGYTVNWNALAPVNEQLHSGEDPWLYWVRGYLAAKTGTLPGR